MTTRSSFTGALRVAPQDRVYVVVAGSDPRRPGRRLPENRVRGAAETPGLHRRREARRAPTAPLRGARSPPRPPVPSPFPRERTARERARGGDSAATNHPLELGQPTPQKAARTSGERRIGFTALHRHHSGQTPNAPPGARRTRSLDHAHPPQSFAATANRRSALRRGPHERPHGGRRRAGTRRQP